MQNTDDTKLWKLARKRAQAKRNLTSYVVVNTVLILIWLKGQGWPPAFNNFWPGWVLFGWGIGLFMSFRDSYGEKTEEIAQREYDKLKGRSQ
jgi:hypothetical protein